MYVIYIYVEYIYIYVFEIFLFSPSHLDDTFYGGNTLNCFGNVIQKKHKEFIVINGKNCVNENLCRCRTVDDTPALKQGNVLEGADRDATTPLGHLRRWLVV